MTAEEAPVRVLSVRQPYADDIIFGDKWNEMRSWSTPYRGRIYIHASRWDGPKEEQAQGRCVTGAIIGHVDLLACCSRPDLRRVGRHVLDGAELPDRLEPLAAILRRLPKSGWDHGDFDVNWIVGNPHVLFRPYEVGGKLNLWKLEVPASDLRARPTRYPRPFEPVPPPARAKRS